MKTTLTLQMAGQHPGPGIAGRQGWIQLGGWQIRSRSWQSSRSSKEYNLVHFSLAGSWLITLTLAVQMSAAVRTAGVSVQGQMVSPGSGWRCSCTFGPQPGSRSPGLGASGPRAPSCPWLMSAMQREQFPRLAFPVTWIYWCEGWCNLHHQHLSQVPLHKMGPFHVEVQSFDVAAFSSGWTKPRFCRFN